MQTYIKPIKQNNDHTRIVRNIRFRSSFNDYFYKNIFLEIVRVTGGTGGTSKIDVMLLPHCFPTPNLSTWENCFQKRDP